jgi:integrase
MRLTDLAIKQLPAPARGNRIAYDNTVKGFGCRVTAAGARSFILTYHRRIDGKQRRLTIGSFPDWGTAAAREEAKRIKREVDGGADPLAAYQELRDAPTVADLCARFERDYLPRKRPTTQRVYRQQIGADILPALGGMKVAAVSHAGVDAWHRKLGDRAPTHANRTLALLSKMFSLAIRWGWRTDNPCRGIERNPENKRHRYLSPAELTRLAAALVGLRDVNAANAVRLLLLSGARRGELLAAKWTDIDLDAAVWIKPAATTKQATLHRVPLSEAACQVLTEMRAGGDHEATWLFPARGGGHRLHINDAWIKLRQAANLPDVHLHDLRHTYASVLASAGLSLPIIGRLLGHTTAQTTMRYSHLFDDPLRAATERAAAIITRKPAADVVPLKGSRNES